MPHNTPKYYIRPNQQLQLQENGFTAFLRESPFSFVVHLSNSAFQAQLFRLDICKFLEEDMAEIFQLMLKNDSRERMFQKIHWSVS